VSLEKKNPYIFSIRDFGADDPTDSANNNKAIADAISAARNLSSKINIGSGQGVGRKIVVKVDSTEVPWHITNPIFLDGNHVFLEGDRDSHSGLLVIGPHSGIILSAPKVGARCFDPSRYLDKSVDSSNGKILAVSTGSDRFIQFQSNAFQLGRCSHFDESGNPLAQSLDGWRKTSSITIDAFIGIGSGGKLVDGVGTPLFGLGSGDNNPSPWIVRGMDSDKIQFMFRTSDQDDGQYSGYRSFCFRVNNPVGPWRISIQIDFSNGQFDAWVDGVRSEIVNQYNMPTGKSLTFAENFSYPFMIGADGIKSWGADHGNGVNIIGLKISDKCLYFPALKEQRRVDLSPINDFLRYFSRERSTIALLTLDSPDSLLSGLVPAFQGDASGVPGSIEGFYLGGGDTRAGSIRGGVSCLEIQGWHGGSGIQYGLSQHPYFNNLKISGFQHGISTLNVYSTYIARIKEVGIDCHASAVCVESSIVDIQDMDCSPGRVTVCANNSDVTARNVRVLQPSRYMLRFASIEPGDYAGSGSFYNILQDFEGHTPDPWGSVFHARPSTAYPTTLVVDGLDVGTLGEASIFHLADNQKENCRDAVVLAQNIVSAAKNVGHSVLVQGKRWLGHIDLRTVEDMKTSVPDGAGPTLVVKRIQDNNIEKDKKIDIPVSIGDKKVTITIKED
jgi:hypothetical protein